MKKMYKVKCGDVTKEFEEETLIKDIAASFQYMYDYEILSAKVNEDFADLSDKLDNDCNIEFFTLADEYGNRIYQRSARFILALAIRRLLGNKARLIMKHSQDRGAYFIIENVNIQESFINDLNNEFQNIVDSNYLYISLTVSRLEAINFFKRKRMLDKVNLLKYRSSTYVNLHRIDNLYGLYHGKMAYSTGQINNYQIIKLNDGFILLTPNIFSPNTINKVKHNDKIFEQFENSNLFCQSINIKSSADLNYHISQNHTINIVLMSEAYYDNQISNITDKIIDKGARIVLLAGPSSSGKTTTSKKLSIYLSSKGYNTKAISIDDYLIDLKKRQKDADGNIDFESINTIDIDLFNSQIKGLLNNETVYLSRYNFKTGKREFDKFATKLNKNDIIVVEGLHALNESLTKEISKRDKYKIYISPLACINIDNHTHIHTSDIRKIRRIVRDSKTRNIGASQTLKMWNNIQKGEQTNIFPYQNNVDDVINSSLLYELGVLKVYVEPLLYSIDRNDVKYPEALRLLKLLRNFLSIPSDIVPVDSVLREFIGGSCFNI